MSIEKIINKFTLTEFTRDTDKEIRTILCFFQNSMKSAGK